MTDETPSTPPKKKPASKAPVSMISSYRKRQKIGPFIMWGLVVLMLVAGIILLVVWLASGNGPKITLFATETPTATITPSPTNTSTLTPTATETVTPTQTLPPTPSEPFEYTVQEGDTLDAIAKKFSLGDFGIQELFVLNPAIDPATANVTIGQKIMVPNPDYQLPTTTPIPNNLPYGTKVNYIIQAGDNIAAIASMFNSTFEDILTLNKIIDANKIFVGQTIVVRANLVTPTNPPKPTITPGASPTHPSPFTPTPPGAAPSPTVAASPTK